MCMFYLSQDPCPKVYKESIRDDDNDYVPDVCDNCKRYFNPHQQDLDNDTIGSGPNCDIDDDNDGIMGK